MGQAQCIHRQPTNPLLSAPKFCLRYQAWRCAQLTKMCNEQGLSPRDARSELAGQEIARPWTEFPAAKPLNPWDKDCTPSTCTCRK